MIRVLKLTHNSYFFPIPLTALSVNPLLRNSLNNEETVQLMKQALSRNPPLPFPWLQDAAGHYPTAPLPPDICRNLYLTLNFLSRRTLSFLQFLYPDILPATLAPYPLWSSALFARFPSGSPGSFFFLSVCLFLCQPIQDQLVSFLVLKVYSFSVLTEH